MYYGPEFVSLSLDKWAYNNGVVLDFSRSGKPTDILALRIGVIGPWTLLITLLLSLLSIKGVALTP